MSHYREEEYLCPSGSDDPSGSDCSDWTPSSEDGEASRPNSRDGSRHNEMLAVAAAADMGGDPSFDDLLLDEEEVEGVQNAIIDSLKGRPAPSTALDSAPGMDGQVGRASRAAHLEAAARRLRLEELEVAAALQASQMEAEATQRRRDKPATLEADVAAYKVGCGGGASDEPAPNDAQTSGGPTRGAESGTNAAALQASQMEAEATQRRRATQRQRARQRWRNKSASRKTDFAKDKVGCAGGASDEPAPSEAQISGGPTEGAESGTKQGEQHPNALAGDAENAEERRDLRNEDSHGRAKRGSGQAGEEEEEGICAAPPDAIFDDVLLDKEEVEDVQYAIMDSLKGLPSPSIALDCAPGMDGQVGRATRAADLEAVVRIVHLEELEVAAALLGSQMEAEATQRRRATERQRARQRWRNQPATLKADLSEFKVGCGGRASDEPAPNDAQHSGGRAGRAESGTNAGALQASQMEAEATQRRRATQRQRARQRSRNKSASLNTDVAEDKMGCGGGASDEPAPSGAQNSGGPIRRAGSSRKDGEQHANAPAGNTENAEESRDLRSKDSAGRAKRGSRQAGEEEEEICAAPPDMEGGASEAQNESPGASSRLTPKRGMRIVGTGCKRRRRD